LQVDVKVHMLSVISQGRAEARPVEGRRAARHRRLQQKQLGGGQHRKEGGGICHTADVHEPRHHRSSCSLG